jgi:dihydrofolate synthase/folylpolyglutamate synthase
LNLEEWLEYLEQCHPSTIELGLERISKVAGKLPIDFTNTRIITVGGTNGKGSTVSMLSSILEEGGYTTACYTSPHLLVYNERVKLGSRFATDEELCHSFAAVEAAREDIKLTYFEFGTLAALQLFSEYQPDFMLLEVGLGGRLDAVNILDPDIAILTNVALDHMDWLGDTREAIGYEKAGIFRNNKPALVGEANPPESVESSARDLGAHLLVNGGSFIARHTGNELWDWEGARAGEENKKGAGEPSGNTKNSKLRLENLPRNNYPLDNCATVVQAVTLVAPEISPTQIAAGLSTTQLPGRFQQVVHDDVGLVLDVAHNPHAAHRLAAQMKAQYPDQAIYIVVAMLSDKNYQEVLAIYDLLEPQWYLAGIQEDRGLEAKILYNCLSDVSVDKAQSFDSVIEAYTAAHTAVKSLRERDKEAVILVTGSFFTVSAVLELI